MQARGLPVQVTGLGSMMTVHFRGGTIRSPADAGAGNDTARGLFHLEMLARGQYLARRGMVTLSLPMTDADCDGLVAAVDDFLGEYAPLIADA